MNLAEILRIQAAINFAALVFYGIVCLQPNDALFVVGSGLFLMAALFLFAWNIVLAVSLFGDSMDCRGNGLWNTACVQFCFFALPFVKKLFEK